MNAAAIEWRALRVPAALAGAALLLLLVVLHAGAGWLEDKQRAHDRARSELSRAAARYRSASDDTAVYEQYAERFRQLEGSGMIGSERRLSWIEALQEINRELKLPTLRYEITPREPVSLDRSRLDTDHLQLHRSTMTLDIGALHEGDVVALLQSLAREDTGLMEAASCNIRRSRSSATLSYDPRQSNLSVQCRLHWYTLGILEEGAS